MPRMPKSTTSTPAGSVAPGEAVGERDAEAVVAEEDVADAGDEDRGRRDAARRRAGERLDLVGREEEAVAGLAARRRGRGRGRPRSRRRAARRPPCPARCPRRPRSGRRARGRRRRRPARGRSRTRLRAPQRDAVDRRPCPGRAARAPPSSSDVAHRSTCQLADRAVQAHELLRRERLGALEDLARARVRRAHLRLLLVGQAEDVEDQHLVDLAAVEEVARALGRDLAGGPRG